MLALGDGQQGIQTAAGVVKNTDSVNVNPHCCNGMSGRCRRNKVDRRTGAGIGWRLNGDTGKRCPYQQQSENAQANDLFGQFVISLYGVSSDVEFRDTSTLLP